MNERGLTLVELMAALAVFTVLMAAAVGLVTGGLRVYHAVTTDTDLSGDARRAVMGSGAMPGLLKDVAQAEQALSTDPSQLSLLVFGTTVTYRLSGATLERITSVSTATVARNTNAAAFYYYERTPQGTLQASTTPANVALIGARFELSRQARKITVEARAALRNR